MSTEAPFRDRVRELRRVRAGDLKAHPRNWRTHDKAQRSALSAMLDEIGFAGALVAREDESGELVIIDGHLRSGMDANALLPVLVTDLDESEADKLLATYDPIAAMAGTDQNNLRELLGSIRTDNDDVAALLASVSNQAPVAKVVDEDEQPTQPKPRAKPGDLFALGRHRLLCGDATDEDQLARLMQGARADVVFTDPPYGVAYHSKGGASIEGDVTSTAIPLLFSLLDEIASKECWVYVCGGSSHLATYAALFGRHLRCMPRVIVWDKLRTVMAHNGYHRAFELIYVGWREGAGARWFGPRNGEGASDIWRVALTSEERAGHLTAKPVELARRAITNSCGASGVVVDPFVGSGSTLIAAESLERSCYAVDIDPVYVDTTIARWEAITGAKAKKAKR